MPALKAMRLQDREFRALAPGPVPITLLAAGLYLWPLLAGLPLSDPDEGLHAAIAVDMVARGDYLVPRLFGAAFLDKPIVFFFTQAMSVQLLGATEFAVRLPGQLFGLLGAITAGLVGAALAGRSAGMATACVYATLAFPLALNQAAVHDVALVPWTNLAVWAFVLAMRDPGRARWVLGWSALAGVWLGLAALTKGLVGIALAGLPVMVLALVERRLSTRLVLGGLVSLVVAAALAAPWYLAVERAEPGYLYYFFIERHLLGFTTKIGRTHV